MSVRRRRKVESILRTELSDIIQRELKDPRLGFMSVTRVEVSPDMGYARVHVSVFGSDEDQEHSIEALEHAQGFIRRQLAPRISLRTIPRLHFILDQSLEHAEHISRLLSELDVDSDSSTPDDSGAEGDNEH